MTIAMQPKLLAARPRRNRVWAPTADEVHHWRDRLGNSPHFLLAELRRHEFGRDELWRRWFYAESNQENFAVGSARITARMAEISRVAS